MPLDIRASEPNPPAPKTATEFVGRYLCTPQALHFLGHLLSESPDKWDENADFGELFSALDAFLSDYVDDRWPIMEALI